MIPASFDYVKPTSVADAVAALKAGGEDSKVLAGGQSLMPVLRLRLAAPSVLVDCSGLAELQGISDTGDAVTVGAAVTHDAVMRSPVVMSGVPLLAKATATVADPAIRHRGTLGGSLAHADPAGDLPAVARALDASFTIAGASGTRTVGAADFFTDYFTTAVGPDEILVSVSFPKLGAGWGSHYEKFHRTAQAWAIVGVAAAVKVDGGAITAARIGLTNMAPTPVRASAVEAALVGASTPQAIADACQQAAEGTSPTSDLHAQSDYREHLARVLTARAVRAAAGI